LPEPHRFAATLGRLGISADDRVVVYDDQSGAIAARLWWMLGWLGHEAVAVLDGGIQAWLAHGGALETGVPAWQAATYDFKDVRRDSVVTTTAVESLNPAAAVLVDARAPARFAGREEPIDTVAGHVPQAVNWPFSATLSADGTLLPPEDQRQRYLEITGGGTREFIAMCGSGVTACHLLLSLATAGLTGKLYAGSWSEWIRSADRPIASERS
jgi:thiosulfate/3-mercaptopyruvate sulfurtransferase